jgi:hypothetical protein
MAEFTNPTIVISWEPKKYGVYGCFAILDAQPKMPVRIKGAGFAPRSVVKITACEKDIFVAEAKVNACGAFEVHVNLPSTLPIGVISVKAWAGGEKLVAVWPLDVVKELPPLPKM